MTDLKVWALPAQEDWICDRFCREWQKSGMGVAKPEDAHVIWLLSDWMWNHVPPTFLLSGRPVVATVHHIVPEKFGHRELGEFFVRDKYITAYHVPSEKTREQLHAILSSQGIAKSIFSQPFWVNPDVWHALPGPRTLHSSKFGIAPDRFIVGSAQRDTEGSDLTSPKLEKGPDILCDELIKLQKKIPSLTVLLAGWRRQYVTQRLTRARIPFVYEERPSIERINELYNAIDCYIVSSRYEGGPQAIFECAATRTPIVSRDVGAASQILHPSSIGDNLAELVMSSHDMNKLDHAEKCVSSLYTPQGFAPFKEFFETLERRTPFSVTSPGIGKRATDV